VGATVTVGRTTIEVVRGDITKEDVDAIVNAANSGLMGGGGVDGAIHRAGGPEIKAECKVIVERDGRLPPGRAVITTAGNMPARHVIHTVGPVYSGSPENPKTLASCYTESLKLADANALTSVAFPAISCGVYGYPLGEAAEVSVNAVADCAREGRTAVTLVRFVMFAAAAEAAFTDAAEGIAE
jgi:O-acetyl-ADP-ribose deacetylase (regulator of RNase III)